MNLNAANIVEVRGLSRDFGATLALDDLSLDIEPGLVYGLVGANGSGKTTLIKHLLGLLRAQSGTVRVFGLDPVSHPVDVLGRIGFLSEDRGLPPWMRIDELMRYTAAYHANWDSKYADHLLSTFRLDGSKKISKLSKGTVAQVGLIAAVSHHPDLLLLDEPSTGLDAIVRRDILNEVIRAVADDGRAALFSSHLLDEVEQMSDAVLLINDGRLVMQGRLDDIKERHHRLVLKPIGRHEADRSSAIADIRVSPGVLSVDVLGETLTTVIEGTEAAVRSVIACTKCEVHASRLATLQEIFVARVGRPLGDAEQAGDSKSVAVEA